MLTPRIRLTADRNTTVPLRFDDEAFLAALERDASDEQDDVKTPLARLLGVKRAADYDATPLVEIGLTIHARPSVPGNAEKSLYTDARKGDGVDIAAFNAARWALWVTGVTVSDDVEWPAEDRKTWAKLASSDKRARQEGYGELERRLQDVLTCRLRVHIDEAGRPADRDPGKAETDSGTW